MNNLTRHSGFAHTIISLAPMWMLGVGILRMGSTVVQVDELPLGTLGSPHPEMESIGH
jgi:hypothetical protein